MKIFNTTLLTCGLCCVTLPLLADQTLTIPPLKIKAPATGLVPAGDWTAPDGDLDYSATKKRALAAEVAGKTAEALTAWERVIDRTVCTADDRAEARAHIKELRPKVAPNTDPAKAKKWPVLALIYKEVKIPGTPGKPEGYHRVMEKTDIETIAKELAGWRDLVFEFSSGSLLLDFDAVLVEKPLTSMKSEGGKYNVDRTDALPDASPYIEKKKYDTVISYAKYRNGKGPNLPRPHWVAATFPRTREFNDAGYIMIPWGEDYPFVGKGELWGEMELHEWLHQMDVVIHRTLGYPPGVAQNPDSGGSDREYVRPSKIRTWAYFYRHIMAEHITRQVWTEVSIRRSPSQGEKPGL